MAIAAASDTVPREATASTWEPGRDRAGYLFLLPWLIGFFALTLGPVLASLYLSFTDFDLLRDPRWIGLDNYVRIATSDPKFTAAMRVTFLYVALAVPFKLVFALAVAMILNRGIAGLPLYRAMFYLPSLLGASVAIAVLWRKVFAGDGLVNQLLAQFGIEGPSWISNPDYALYTLVALTVWQFGSPMIIFLAGLRQIPRGLYEAAEVDGATRCAAVLAHHAAAADAGDLLQRGGADDRCLQGLHARLHHLERHRRPDRLDAVLHALSLPGGVRVLPHGLCGGARLDSRGHHCGLHGLLVPHLALLGALR